MIETIYIVRHGHRASWFTHDWPNVTGVAKDPPIAALGHTQAAEVGHYFASLPESKRPSAIFSSPYIRCLQTAEPTSKALGLPIFVEHGLSEWYAPVVPGTGLHPRPGSAASLKTHIQSIDVSWSSLYYPTRKGESMAELHARCGEVLEILGAALQREAPGQHRCILLFSHGAPTIALTRALVGEKNLRLGVGCCSVTELVRKVEGQPGKRMVGAFNAEQLASGDHLAEGTQRAWGFHDYITRDDEAIPEQGIEGSEIEEDSPVGPRYKFESVIVENQARM